MSDSHKLGTIIPPLGLRAPRWARDHPTGRMHSLLGDDSVSSRGDVAALLTRLGFDEHNAAEAAAAPAAVSDDDGWVFFVDSVMQRLVGSNSPRRRAAPGGYDARRVASSVTASAARRSLLAVAVRCPAPPNGSVSPLIRVRRAD